MAGHERGNNKPDADTTRDSGAEVSAGSLADALSATQQHTVPILPSFATDEADDAPTQTTRASQTTYARRTLAPRPTDASTSASRAQRPTLGPARGGSSSRLSAGRQPGAGQTGEVSLASKHDETDAPDAPDAPGRPTIGLPAITGANLPAIVNDDRRVAVAQDGESTALLIRGAKKPPRLHTQMPVVPRRVKPRSFAAQFIVAMVAVMALFTALTLASPLSQVGAFASTFQAYSNAVPWIPTPTPTPKPTATPVPYQPPIGSNPGQQAIINEIVAVFGPYAPGALNISRCESGYDPNAVNPYAIGNSHASGVFQILFPSTWDGTSYASQSPFDYNANIHAAYEIFSRDGYSWREWACKPY